MDFGVPYERVFQPQWVTTDLVETSLKLTILLHQSLKCWNCRCVPPQPSCSTTLDIGASLLHWDHPRETRNACHSFLCVIEHAPMRTLSEGSLKMDAEVLLMHKHLHLRDGWSYCPVCCLFHLGGYNVPMEGVSGRWWTIFSYEQRPKHLRVWYAGRPVFHLLEKPEHRL